MARPNSYAGTGRFALFVFAAFVIAATGISLFIGLGTASGMGEADGSVLGIGSNRSVASSEATFSAAEKLGVADAANPEASQQLAQATQRSGASEAGSAQPVVELAAVDLGDQATIKAAASIGVLNPAEGTPRTRIDTSGDDWLTGEASGYDVESSSTLTRSGRAFDDDCVTVAVPEGMEDLLGHPVVIVYDNMVVVATVTDTGGFAKYGRCLDLGGGVFKAFGFDDIWEWGVRDVHYKFL